MLFSFNAIKQNHPPVDEPSTSIDEIGKTRGTWMRSRSWKLRTHNPAARATIFLVKNCGRTLRPQVTPECGRKKTTYRCRGPESNRSHYISFFIFYLQWYKHDEEHKVSKNSDCNALIERGFSVPPPAMCLLPSAFSTTNSQQFAGKSQQSEPFEIATLNRFWTELRSFVERCKSEHEAECPFVYFFVKYCLDHGLVGVPRAALAVYDRMNLPLSSEFIRCANPTCQHNKLDKSTGKIKFRQCGRCLSVIYCSRECQSAHYPEHKKSCEQYQEDSLSPDDH